MRQIQDAALGLAETMGYEAATMEAIASAAEVSTRSAYRYFGRKEAVFLWDDADASCSRRSATRPSPLARPSVGRSGGCTDHASNEIPTGTAGG